MCVLARGGGGVSALGRADPVRCRSHRCLGKVGPESSTCKGRGHVASAAWAQGRRRGATPSPLVGPNNGGPMREGLDPCLPNKRATCVATCAGQMPPHMREIDSSGARFMYYALPLRTTPSTSKCHPKLTQNSAGLHRRSPAQWPNSRNPPGKRRPTCSSTEKARAQTMVTINLMEVCLR